MIRFPKISRSKNVSGPRKSGRRRLGVAAVEFAVIAPVLLGILFLMIESSRYLTALHATTGAAREVARQASVAGVDATAALTLAKDFMGDSNFKSTNVSVMIESKESAVSGLISYSATVTIPFADVSVVGDPFNLDVTEVRGQSAILAPGTTE